MGGGGTKKDELVRSVEPRRTDGRRPYVAGNTTAGPQGLVPPSELVGGLMGGLLEPICGLLGPPGLTGLVGLNGDCQSKPSDGVGLVASFLSGG